MDEAERQDIICALRKIIDRLHEIERNVNGLKQRVDALEIGVDGVLTILESVKPT